MGTSFMEMSYTCMNGDTRAGAYKGGGGFRGVQKSPLESVIQLTHYCNV